MKNEKRIINVLAQAIYGNRTEIAVKMENFDALMSGWLDYKLFDAKREKIDRTIVHLPNDKSGKVVVVYNKYHEEEEIVNNKRWLEECGYTAKPLCSIPELNLEIYSRCFLCRIDDNGELQSVQPEDIELVDNYFAW